MEKRKIRLEDISLINELPRVNNICPISNIPFFGKCVLRSCPFNISSLSPEVAGCFKIAGDPSVAEISKHLILPIKEVKKEYNKSLKKLDKFIQFYEWWDEYKFIQKNEEKDKILCYCPNCFVRSSSINNSTTGRECLNVVKCKKRFKLMTKLMKQYPFNIIPLKIEKNDFWNIVEAQLINKINVINSRYIDLLGESLNTQILYPLLYGKEFF